ncbi:MAG TPA: dynamin family protein [Myxococcaceae bacterium]|nr:dynamin family protein [Myxococcaceae bacterium]
MTSLNDNHRRMLEATLTHVDALLAEIEQCTTATSPFARVLPDLTAPQARVILDAMANVRRQLVDAGQSLLGRLPQPSARASWSIRTHLTMLEVALEEASPGRLRAYGQLEPAVVEQVQRVVADLARTVRRLQTYLAQGLGRDLSARLARLEQVPVDLALLRTLERIIVGRGLLELRGPLESLLEKLEAGTFEIAFFGRVSAGKSSLLNRLLDAPVLPVGVTPVTTIPTRVAWGLEPEATITFTEHGSERIPLERLPEFVTEQGNPGNRKRVVRAAVTLPSPLLRDGVVLVDTPGIGSLARSGARETYSYLPRCDLGVALVDAASAPGPEDIELVQLLYESAIPAMVLLSKADLISASDRDRLREYLAGELSRRLELDVPVHPVSTAPAAAELTRAWMERQLLPSIEQARELGGRSARRKLGALREAAVATLETVRRGVPLEPSQVGRARRVEGLAVEMEGVLLAERARVGHLVDDLAGRVSGAWTDAARRWAWSDPESASVSLQEGAERALRHLGERAFAEVRDGLRQARTGLALTRDQLVREVEGPGWQGNELSADFLSVPPLPFPRLPPPSVALPRRWARFPGWSERRARAALEGWTRDAASLLSRYGIDLRDWALSQLERLATQVAADTEPVRARLRRGAEGAAPAADAEGIAADLALLGSPDSEPGAETSPGRALGTPR